MRGINFIQSKAGIGTALDMLAKRVPRLEALSLLVRDRRRGRDMHSYQRRWPEELSDWPHPDLGAFKFRDANDVARFAELDPVLAWRTWPEVWHLDDEGTFRCSSKGSSLDSVRRFAQRPAEMLLCREVPIEPPCPNHWLVIEPRHPWLGDRYEVSEEDARAFLQLRRGLGRNGIVLLDVMVFDQAFHWWSLHELTSGTTTWPS